MRWAGPSFAKVNLHLEVLGRRPDGYHELRTVFQTVDLADEVVVALEGQGISLRVEEGEAPEDPGNLAWRAAAAYLDLWPTGTGVRLALRKRVPAGGGLGGGSANAATVLLALRHLTGRPADRRELGPLAAALGADVPYFLVGGTALGTGRGDRVEALPDLPAGELVLAIPRDRVPTPAVFAAVSRLTASAAAPRIGGTTQDGFSSWVELAAGVNDLEPVVFAGWPGVGDVHRQLSESGAEWVRLSGSGATVFARFAERPDMEGLGERLPEGCRLELVRTLGRDGIARRRGIP